MRLPFPNGGAATTALIDAESGDIISYQQLDDLVEARMARLGIDRGVALLLCRNTIATVVDYLAALRAGLAVMPFDAATDAHTVAGLLATYRPDVVLGADESLELEGCADTGEGIWVRVADDVEVCGDLAILLSTSGSTGSPRMVRLTAANIAANTRSIIASLGITAVDRAITSMPLHYSYGLSVLNTHLAAGASVVVSGASIIDPAFWAAVRDHEVTTIAGVPYTFAMLSRLRFDPATTPSLRSVTQAGGKLDLDATRTFHERFSAAGVGLYIMYGQTEAGPRISCLPADRLGEKIGSAGLAMEGGTLSIEDDGAPLAPGEVGEVVYSGPNVMLGYATRREELTCRDDTDGVLRTGDLGYLDEDGYLYITGRIKRIAKLFGSRVSLDEVEAHLAALGPVAAVAGGEDRLHIHHQNIDADAVVAARKALSLELKVPLAAVHMHLDSEFPLMPSGKVNYRELTRRHEEGA